MRYRTVHRVRSGAQPRPRRPPRRYLPAPPIPALTRLFQVAKEDISDLMAEAERKRKRKLESGAAAGGTAKRGKKEKDFKF